MNLGFETVDILCRALVAWLALTAGISRENANSTLRALNYILSFLITLIFQTLSAHGFHFPHSNIGLPRDSTTLYNGVLATELKRISCCPTCYKLYHDPHNTDNPMPATCDWRRSSRAQKCGTALWRTQKQRKNGSKQVPACYYTLQSLPHWLSFFLSRPKIEELLHSIHVKYATADARADNCTSDIHKSRAWQSLRDFLIMFLLRLSRQYWLLIYLENWFSLHAFQMMCRLQSACWPFLLICKQFAKQLVFSVPVHTSSAYFVFVAKQIVRIFILISGHSVLQLLCGSRHKSEKLLILSVTRRPRLQKQVFAGHPFMISIIEIQCSIVFLIICTIG